MRSTDGHVRKNLSQWSFSPEDGSRFKITVVWVVSHVILYVSVVFCCVSDESPAFIIRMEESFPT